MENKIKLYGFNNLTKSLCFNIFDVCYTMSEQDQKEYVAYIDERYPRKTSKYCCMYR